MIESVFVRDIASFDSSGVRIENLNKINFIYGANGSGKTTISNFLANPSCCNSFSQCTCGWKHGQKIQTLVYNKKFRDENFGKGAIAGVFTLGKATKEEIEIIEKKQEQLKDINEQGLKKKETLEKQQIKYQEQKGKFKEFAWSKIYKTVEIEFKEALKGSLTKERFKSKILEESETNVSDLLEYDELKEKSKIIFGKEPTSIARFTPINLQSLPEIEKNQIWLDKILGKSDVNIAKLIQKLNLNDWVNKGREYIQESEICPFCQQKTITDDFKDQLENYFDESFTESIKKVKELSEEYDRKSKIILSELETIELREKLNDDTTLDRDKFSASIKTYQSIIEYNNNIIKDKLKEPSRSVKLKTTIEQASNIEGLILKANQKIDKHNQIVANFNLEKQNLIISVWKYLVEKFKEEIKEHNQIKRGLKKGIDNLAKELETKRTEYKELKEEINDLTKNVTSIQPTIDQINNTLESFGFNNFKIVPCDSQENHYQIKREDGALAESTLSEGEVTFITFLYFLQLAKGSVNKDSISDERVLIIDDPISSLDSNVLFIVSSLIKRIIREIKNGSGFINQIILLTHNVYFHKEVSFIDGRTKECKDTSFWILRKTNNLSSVQYFHRRNPIQTSYELLWLELKNKDRNSGVTIQNTMRRIIENYFKILGKYGDDDLIQKFSTHEEQEICRSLICWINDGSHSIADDLFIEAHSDNIAKYESVFREIFTLTGHEGHYKMMIGEQEEETA